MSDIMDKKIKIELTVAEFIIITSSLKFLCDQFTETSEKNQNKEIHNKIVTQINDIEFDKE